MVDRIDCGHRSDDNDEYVLEMTIITLRIIFFTSDDDDDNGIMIRMKNMMMTL